MNRHLGSVFLLSLTLATSGCSSLVGQEFKYGTKDADGKLAGVPFTINRAVPTIVRSVSAGTERVNYVVTFNYVPDSSKRYTLQIDPSILSSVDFSMSFDAGGSLTDVTSKSADQTGAIIATIGKIFLVAAADTGPSGNDAVVANVLSQGDMFASSPGAPAHARESWKVIKADLAVLGTEAKIRSDYFYRTPEQRDFLQRFARYLGAKVSKNKDVGANPPQLGDPIAAKSFWDELDRYLGNAPIAEDQAFGAAAVDAFSTGGVRKLDDLKKAQVTTLQKQRLDFEIKKLSKDYQGMKRTVGRLSVLKAAAKAMPPEVDLVVSIAELSTTDWARRALVPLGKEIEAKQQELRILRYALGLESKRIPSEAERADANKARDRREAAAKTPLDQAVDDLNKLLVRKANILGVGREAERRQQLADMLVATSIPKDFKPIRDERDALDTAVANAEANTKAKAKEAVVDDPYVGRYMNVPPGAPAFGPGEIVAELDRIKDKEERPRYVVVVRSLEPPTSKPEISANANETGKPVVGKEGTESKGEPISSDAGDLPPPKAPEPPAVKK